LQGSLHEAFGHFFHFGVGAERAVDGDIRSDIKRGAAIVGDYVGRRSQADGDEA
jgi:hypothetical protein